MITVMLIDDHTIVRKGIRQMLQNIKGIQVVGEAGTGSEAVQITRELHPQVVVLDFKLPDITGLEVTSRLMRFDPDLKILIVTASTNDIFPFRILEAGARGYLTKNCTKEELVHSIKAIHAGHFVISPEVASRLALAKIDSKADTVFSVLTDREMEVLMMMIRAVSVNDIATRLFLSTKTVHSYRSRIFDKLHVTNDVALTLLALREGIIALEEAGS